MVNNTLTSQTPVDSVITTTLAGEIPSSFWQGADRGKAWSILGAAVFLVSVPVFVEAPLVRFLPALSVALTGVWVWLGCMLLFRPTTRLWGDLVLGFTWSWLAGAIYWGWFRGEPLLHLPIEAIGLPFAIWSMTRSWGKIGSFFYFGSLFGTAVTDLYFYLVNLIPHWRQIMQAEQELIMPIFQSAVAQVHTPWGLGWITVLVGVLGTTGLISLRSPQLHWWAFGGAVLSTILVDGLFWLAAAAA